MQIPINWPQALAGACVGVIVGSLFSEVLKKVWSALAQELIERKVRRVSGHWDTEFSYIDQNGQRIAEADAVRLRQWGAHVTGKNEGRTTKQYVMSGKFRNETVLTGTWTSIRPEVTYNGAFQLIVSADGQNIEGRWLGISKHGGVRHGEWLWKRRP